jgi:hypothetical protein
VLTLAQHCAYLIKDLCSLHLARITHDICGLNVMAGPLGDRPHQQPR